MDKLSRDDFLIENFVILKQHFDLGTGGACDLKSLKSFLHVFESDLEVPGIREIKILVKFFLVIGGGEIFE